MRALCTLLVGVATWLAVSPAHGQGTAARFPEQKHSWLNDLFAAPDALYFVSSRYLHVARRGAEAPELIGALPRSAKAVSGTPDGAAIAAAGEDGHVGRWSGGQWDTGQAPVPAHSRYREDFVAVAVAADGVVYAATEEDGLYLWRGGEDWTVIPYPDVEGADVGVHALVLVAGEPVIGGDHGLCQRRSGEAWLDLAGVGGRVEDLWLDDAAGALYVLDGFGELMAVDTSTWTVRSTWEIPLFGPSALAGAIDPHTGKPVLTIGAQSEVGLLSDGIFRQLPISLSFVRGAWFDAATELVYTANRDGLLSRWVGDAFRRDPSTGRRTGVAGEPAEAPDAPDALELSWRLGLALHQGPLWKVHPTTRAAAYQLSLQLRSEWLWQDDGDGFGLVGTVAYSFEDTKRSGHLVELGLGAAWREGVWLGVSYLPRAVLGSPDGRVGAGVRHGVVVDTLLGLMSVEIGHQALWIDGAARHDVRMVFGVDLFMVYQLAVVQHLLFSWL